MWTLKFNCESNQTQRFRTLFTIATLVSPTVRVPRLTLLSCWQVPIYNMSSVLFSLSFSLSGCLWREYTVPWHVLSLLHCPNAQCPITKATLFDLAVYRSTLQKRSKATENNFGKLFDAIWSPVQNVLNYTSFKAAFHFLAVFSKMKILWKLIDCDFRKCFTKGFFLTENEVFWNFSFNLTANTRYLQTTALKIFRLCLVGYLHLNERFDAGENFWIIAGGFDAFWSTSHLAGWAFDHLNGQHTGEFDQNGARGAWAVLELTGT